MGRVTSLIGVFVAFVLLIGSAHAQVLGRGCTTIWAIDADCDGYGVAVRASGAYGGPGLGDKPDADDTDAKLNTPASVLAVYDANANGTLETSELKAFLTARKGVTAGNIFYLSPTGSNATGAVNDPTKPYATYAGVHAALVPGDVVLFQAGTYANPYMVGPYPSLKSGMPGKPIVIMTAPGAKVVLNTTHTAIETWGAHDLKICGFQIDNPNNTGYGFGLSFNITSSVVFCDLEIQRFYFVNAMQDIHAVTLENLVIHHNTEHGLYMGSRELPSSDITVKGSLLYKNGIALGYGAIQFNGRVTNLVIDDNVLHSNGQWGISLKMGVSKSVFRNNLIFNNQGHGIIFDVYADNCGAGICPYPQNGNLITQNTIWIGKYDLKGAVPSTPENGAAVLVARNVGKAGDGLYDQGNNTFERNIFVTQNGPAFRYTSAEWLNTTTIRNNALFKVTGPSDLVHHGTSRYAFALFQSAMWPLVTGNLFGDPQFAASDIAWWNTPERFDLNLRSGSPAVGLGRLYGSTPPPPPPPPPPPTCTFSAWSVWVPITACAGSMLTEQRTRTANLSTCAPLSETRAVSCTMPPPPPPVDPCLAAPFDPTQLARITVTLTPLVITLTDTRGCSVTR